MPKLIQQEPDGKKRLYKGVDPERVDADTCEFTDTWLKKALRIPDIRTIRAHIKAGHFGHTEEISSKNHRFMLGHRAIAMFNNDMQDEIPGGVLSRKQYKDLQEGRPVRNMVVLVSGKPVRKDVSLLKYDPEIFIAVPKYSNDQARALATHRVQSDVESKSVPWHSLDKNSDEYKMKWQTRASIFLRSYENEMILIAKAVASDEEVRAAADLPAGVLALLTQKLSITDAEYFIARYCEYDNYIENLSNNPGLSFWVQQVISEELQIEHLRDVQRLYGDKIDSTLEAALDRAVKRHHHLISGYLKTMTAKNPPNTTNEPNTTAATQGKVPLNPPVNSTDAFEDDD